MVKKHVAMMLAALVIALVSPSVSHAGSLISNGNFSMTSGFNSGNSTNGSGQINTAGNYAFAGGTVTGWTSTNYNFLFTAGSPQAANGHYGALSLGGGVTTDNLPGGGSNFIAADANGGYNGAITQTGLSLVANQSYTLTFDYALATQSGYSGNANGDWKVTLDGLSIATPTLTLSTSNNDAFSGWVNATYTFTAATTQASATLSFLGQSTEGVPPFMLLDNVTLNAVPEPSALMLFGAGVFGVIAAQVRRRRLMRAAV